MHFFRAYVSPKGTSTFFIPFFPPFFLLFVTTCSSFESQPILMLLSFIVDVVNFCINSNPVLEILLVFLFSVGVVCRSVSLNVGLLLKGMRSHYIGGLLLEISVAQK